MDAEDTMSGTGELPRKRRRQIPRKPQPDTTSFKARTSPRSIYKLIQVLSDEQKHAVREIGLGSILNLAISHCPVHIGKYLLMNLDIKNLCIILQNGDNINLEEEDVQTVLNIPRGNVAISESLGTDRADQEYNDFLRAWRDRWGIESNIGGPSTGEMFKRLSESDVGDNNFKVDFTVLFVSLFCGVRRAKLAGIPCHFKVEISYL